IVSIGAIILTRFQKTALSNPFFTRLKRTFGVFIISLILPIIYGNYNIKQMIIMVVIWVVGYLVVLFVPYEEFKDIFTSIMTFLAIFSLVTFAIKLVSVNLFSWLPTVEKNGVVYYNALFAIISSSKFIIRNFGIFWEPGAFSIFLNIALYFELFENKFNPKRVLLFFITIISTVSTLGIVCIFILFFAFITVNKNLISNRIKFIVSVTAVISIIGMIVFGDEYILQAFGKLGILEGSTVNDSTNVRVNAIIYPGTAFLQNPVLGVGYNDYLFIQERFCENMATCSFLNLLCLFGLVGGLLPIIGCVRFFVINNHTFLTKCFLFGFVMLLFSTENFILCIAFYIFVFYGYTKKNSKSLVKKLI
ncbi:MAG: hypothetical protein IJN49_06115, partial [Clostridia bacterium]|nr:hypothetical protein [Clostridia bacterium]